MCRNVAWLAVAPVLLVLAACGPSRPAVAPVTGRITIDGKPVTTGVVVYYPQTGRPATGQIGPDGRYTLGTFTPTDGALPGPHRVVIESRTAATSTPRPARPAGPPPPGTPDDISQEWAAGPLSAVVTETEWLVPETYAAQSTTALRADVALGSNVIDFDLPAD